MGYSDLHEHVLYIETSTLYHKNTYELVTMSKDSKKCIVEG